MARVYDGNGFQVHIWLNDHPPAHVHVYRAEGLAIIDLDTLNVRAAYDLKPAELRRASEIVEENRSHFAKEWRKIHG